MKTSLNRIHTRTPQRRSKTYATKRQDLQKRLDTCKLLLKTYIETSKDAVRKERARKFLNIFEWQVTVRPGALSGEIRFSHSCLASESKTPLTLYWFDTLYTQLNKYSLDKKSLEILIKCLVRSDKDLIKKLL